MAVLRDSAFRPPAGESEPVAPRHVRCLAPDMALTFAGYHRVMADAASLDERLEQIGTQLDWVRDYL
jgi:hypothetical protein